MGRFDQQPLSLRLLGADVPALTPAVTQYRQRRQSATPIDCVFNQSITAITKLNNVLILIQLPEMVIVLLLSHCLQFSL